MRERQNQNGTGFCGLSRFCHRFVLLMAWILFGGRKNLKPEKCLKMP